jgi:hypothetical protein
VNSKDKIKVCELFAGVGGFRVGLEGWKGKSATSGYKKDLHSNFDINELFNLLSLIIGGIIEH